LFFIVSLPFNYNLVYNIIENYDEVITLEKKASPKNTAVTSNHPNQKHYHNPTETWWGKIIVWILIFGMVGLIILSFVLAVISGTA